MEQKSCPKLTLKQNKNETQMFLSELGLQSLYTCTNRSRSCKRHFLACFLSLALWVHGFSKQRTCAAETHFVDAKFRCFSKELRGRVYLVTGSHDYHAFSAHSTKMHLESYNEYLIGINVSGSASPLQLCNV